MFSIGKVLLPLLHPIRFYRDCGKHYLNANPFRVLIGYILIISAIFYCRSDYPITIVSEEVVFADFVSLNFVRNDHYLQHSFRLQTIEVTFQYEDLTTTIRSIPLGEYYEIASYWNLEPLTMKKQVIKRFGLFEETRLVPIVDENGFLLYGK